MTAPGAGDRWLAGELPEGVQFAPGASVRVVAGAHEGESATVVLLVGLRPEPRYLVRITATGESVRVAQPALEAAG